MSDPSSLADAVGKYYDRQGPHWSIVWGDNLHVGYWQSEEDDASLHEAQDRLTDLLISKTPVGRGDVVLDVGCGPGKPAVRLAEKTGCDVIGITVSKYQIEKANALAKAKGLNDRVWFRYANAMDLPFEDNTFDAVWAFESLFYMDHELAWSEIYRVLKPGGVLVFTDIYKKKLPPELEAAAAKAEIPPKLIEVFGTISHFITLDEYEEPLTEIGFEIEVFTDLSEHQARTIEESLPVIKQRRKDFVKAYDEEFADTVEWAWNVFSKSYHINYGYVLAVVRKPLES